MKVLKEGLTAESYDQVRACLGLKPLNEATLSGRKITDNIRKNIEEKTSLG